MNKSMRILVAHNRYQYAGGEDAVVQAEIALLRANGHAVEVMEENNDSVVAWTDAAATALRCVYSRTAARETGERIAQFAPDLVHVHNFFPRLSPSVHYACRNARVPVVQTLHNYRLLCPAATFLRDGKVCEDCMGKALAWPAALHGCYRQSKVASAAVANMLAVHRACGTWSQTVTRFIALTEFARQKFIAGGLAQDRIVVKPNFLDPDPGIGTGDGGYAIYVGRLSVEKGIDTLLAAWSQLPLRPPLKIVGDGPLASSVKDAVATMPEIEWLGQRGKDEISSLMAHATVLIIPSIWYEGLPMVIPEAFAVGLPVIASRHGSLEELVSEGENGRMFAPGNAGELGDCVVECFSHPDRMKSMRLGARRQFEMKYTAAANYALLSEIYTASIAGSGQGHSA